MHTKPGEPCDTPKLIITKRENLQYQSIQI